MIKILLVDDDEDDFILTKDILNEHPNSQNYTLTWCNNYSEAIDAMLKGVFDIYLVDYQLGISSGLDLLSEAVKANCTDPIILLTGKGDSRIDLEAMQLGAADYLVKGTLNSEILERSIRYAIARNNTSQRLHTSENKFHILFSRSNDPILITNASGQVIEANPAALTFFEASLKELLQVNTATLYKNRQDKSAYISAMNANGSISDLRIEIQTPNGKSKSCRISSFLQLSQNESMGFSTLIYTILHLDKP